MTTPVKIISAVIVVAVIAGGAWLLTQNGSDKSSNQNTQNEGNPTALTITYDDDGFSPSTGTVQSGQAVTFVNNSKEEIDPSSNPHPVHTDNAELNVGDIEPGDSKTVTLTAKGTWGYHNHYDHDKSGTITVK